MQIINTDLLGVLIITPKAFVDQRGILMEARNLVDCTTTGITVTFMQDNLSLLKRGILL